MIPVITGGRDDPLWVALCATCPHIRYHHAVGGSRPCEFVVDDDEGTCPCPAFALAVTLDSAWAEAEAALPPGWSNGPTLFGYDVLDDGGRTYVASVVGPKLYRGHRVQRLVEDGSTPTEALQALAAALRDRR